RAGRLRLEAELRVDVLVGEGATRQVAEHVASQFAHKARAATESRDGDGLVGAFAAGAHAKVAAEYGLAPLGQPRCAKGEVGDEAAQHDNAGRAAANAHGFRPLGS